MASQKMMEFLHFKRLILQINSFNVNNMEVLKHFGTENYA